MSGPGTEGMTEEQKKEQYAQFIAALRKDLGLEKLEKAIDHIMAFNRPATENQQQPQQNISGKMTEEDKKKLMDADNALDFIDRLGGILQKYNVIESGPSDPYMKMQQVFAMSYMDLLNWQARENMKDWQKMKHDKDHKT